MLLVLVQNKPIKKVLVILFIFISTGLFGQETPSKSTFGYGFSISPEVNNLFVFRNGEHSSPAFGFTSLVFIRKNLGSKVKFETGIGYGLRQFNHLHTGLVFGTDIDPQQGIISYSELKTQATLNEIQVPIFGVFQIKESNFAFTFGLAGHYQWVNKAERTIIYGNGDENTQLNTIFNPHLNFSTAIGCRYTQPISEKIGLIVEPKFTFYFREYIVPLTQLYSGGLKLGLILE